jgi:hypothetical protein
MHGGFEELGLEVSLMERLHDLRWEGGTRTMIPRCFTCSCRIEEEWKLPWNILNV